MFQVVEGAKVAGATKIIGVDRVDPKLKQGISCVKWLDLTSIMSKISLKRFSRVFALDTVCPIAFFAHLPRCRNIGSGAPKLVTYLLQQIKHC